MTGKKLFTDQLLQPLHLLANGGLSSADGGSSCCKSVEIGDRNKRSQQIEVEIHYRTICIYHIYSLSGCSCGAARVEAVCVTVKQFPLKIFPRIPARQTA
ncbi:hypothetical protein EKTHUN627_22890 [Enterobacter kobei]|nr:hypothetical protein EKTHUN627_22890 [Enterobacter kobei]GJA00633.1 hypothetical protein ECV0102_09810 [Enterobacter cloacae]